MVGESVADRFAAEEQAFHSKVRPILRLSSMVKGPNAQSFVKVSTDSSKKTYAAVNLRCETAGTLKLVKSD